MVAEFDILGPGLANIKTDAPKIGETLRYNCETGAVLERATASDQDVTVGTPVFSAGVVTISFDGEASNPLVSHSPAITVHGTIRLDTNIKNVGFQGKITRFPAFEAYLSVDNRNTVTIFQIAPAKDASPWSLFLTTPVNPTVPY